MQKIFTILFTSLILLGSTQAKTIFEKSIGSHSCYEEGFSIVALTNNEYLVSAAYNCTGNPNDWNPYQIKIDQTGEMQTGLTQTPLNGLMTKTNDNHLIYAGGEKAGMQYDSIRIFKTDFSGNIIWETPLAFASCKNSAWDVVTNASNEIFITGTYPFTNCNNPMYNGFVTKLNADGEIIWTQFITGESNDQLYSVKPTHDGGAVAFGWTTYYPSGSHASMLIKLNAFGDIEFKRTYTDINSNFSQTYGYGIEVTDQNEYVMIGYSDQIFVTKTDAKGHVLWHNHYGAACGGIYFKSLQTKDGGFAFLANKSTESGCRTALFKTDRNGNIVWEKVWNARMKDVYEKSDGSFLLTGFIDYLPQIHVIHFDTLQLVQNVTFNHNLISEKVDTESDINVITVEKLFTDKLITSQQIESQYTVSNINTLSASDNSLNVYPIPAYDFVKFDLSTNNNQLITIEIFNLQGQIVYKKEATSAEEIIIYKKNLNAGQYFYLLKSDTDTYNGKIVFQ